MASPALLERHTGEGSASALETLQRLESSRVRPVDPAPELDAPGEPTKPAPDPG